MFVMGSVERLRKEKERLWARSLGVQCWMGVRGCRGRAPIESIWVSLTWMTWWTSGPLGPPLNPWEN